LAGFNDLLIRQGLKFLSHPCRNSVNLLFHQRLCSRLTALRRYINFVLLLLLLLEEEEDRLATVCTREHPRRTRKHPKTTVGKNYQHQTGHSKSFCY